QEHGAEFARADHAHCHRAVLRLALQQHGVQVHGRFSDACATPIAPHAMPARQAIIRHRLSSRTARVSAPILEPSTPGIKYKAPQGYLDPGSRASRSAGMTALGGARDGAGCYRHIALVT